ncbi:MAG: dTDP-4-dehydrorhamnose reductase [Acidobacteriota bacterium]|nr:dTDP-4-dehydrorhamnose reductase [Acidobacteriota bacterium]
MRSLVLGAGGLVGGALLAELSSRGFEVVGAVRDDLDITDRSKLVDGVIALAPEIVFNCAAFTGVDGCESRPDDARRVNHGGVVNVVAAARAAAARVVHVSTDYVFDGRAQVPYREEDPPAPQSVYGTTKLAGEAAALADPRSLVVRSSWIFGSTRASFVQTVLGLLEAVEDPRIVDDQQGCPTYAPFLARGLVDLAAAGSAGLVHYRNRAPVTWFGFARAIAAAVGSARLIMPVDSAAFPRPATRPAYSVLDVSRFELRVARSVEDWRDGLDDCLTRLGAVGAGE